MPKVMRSLICIMQTISACHRPA